MPCLLLDAHSPLGYLDPCLSGSDAAPAGNVQPCYTVARDQNDATLFQPIDNVSESAGILNIAIKQYNFELSDREVCAVESSVWASKLQNIWEAETIYRLTYTSQKM